MQMKAQEIQRILKHIVLQCATDTAEHGIDHNSLICFLPVNSWQAEIMRKSDITRANNPSELRQAMQDPRKPVIFLGHEAVVTRGLIENVCMENPLRKTIIWEKA